jgi:VanZ family protein
MVQTEEDFADTPKGSSWRGFPAILVVAAVFLAGAACVAGVLGAVFAAWGVPSWLTGILGPHPGFLALLWLVMLLGWSGFAPAWLADGMLRRPLYAMGLPLWAAAGGAVSLLLSRLAGQALGTASDDASGTILGRPGFLAELPLHCAVFLLLVAGSGAALAAGRIRWPRSLYCAGLMFLLAAPWFLMARVLALGLPGLADVSGALRQNPVAGDIPAAVLLVMASALGCAVAQVLAAPTVWRVVWAAAGMAVPALPGCLLANLVLRPEDSAGGPGSGLVWWLLVQSFVVLGLSLGAAAALRLSPRPVEAPSRMPCLSGRVFAVLTGVYALLIVYGSLVPLDLIPLSFPRAVEKFLHTPYLSLGVENRADLVANLLLYVPLTFLAMGAATGQGTRPGRGAAAVVVVVAASALALLVEFVQEFFAPRTVSWNDVLVECIGSVIGAACWLVFGPHLARGARNLRSDSDPRRTAVRILAVYTALACLYQVLPMDFVISRVELLARISRGGLTLVPFDDWARQGAMMMTAKFIAAVPLGFLVGLLVRRGSGRAAAGLVVGLLASAVLQAVRLFIYTRTSSMTDVALWAAGGAMGAWLTHWLGPVADRPISHMTAMRRLVRISMGLCAAGLIAAMAWRKWGSLRFSWPRGGLLRHTWESLRVPFYHQYYNTEFQACTQLLAAFASMAALGLLLRGFWGEYRRFALWCSPAATCVFSVALEVGRLLLPGRIADATTAAFAIAGGVVGSLAYPRLVRWFVLPPAVQ